MSREFFKCVKGFYDKKIIYRDVKFNNVLFMKNGLWLIDFGGVVDLKMG